MAKKARRVAEPADDVTPIAILTADMHLQPCAWADRRRCSGDAYWSFRQIISLAVKHGVRHIIAAGDILDAKRHDTVVPSDVAVLLHEVADAGLVFNFVQGDHDALSSPWPTLLSPGEAVQHRQGTCVIEGVKFAFFDWQPSAALPIVLSQVPKDTEVVVMHQTLDELTGGLFAGEMSAAQIPHAGMLVVGDIHKAVVQTCQGASGQSLMVVSPGSICKQSIDEDDSKSVFLLCRDLAGNLGVKKLKLHQRETLRYAVYDDETTENMLDSLDADIVAACARMERCKAPPDIAAYPQVAVEIGDTQVPNWRRIVRAVGRRAELFRQSRNFAVAAGEGAPVPLTADAAVQLEIVNGGVPAAIRQQIQDEADRDLLLRLWNADNPNRELQQMLADDEL